MENEIYINLSNERFISLFDNRIEENYTYNIINYIYNYDEQIRNSQLLGRYQSPLYRYTPIYHDEIVLPAFVEQELVIPDDAVCGITFEKPDCRTSCGHLFCRAEITRWLEQQKNLNREMTCPSCRGLITEVSVCKKD